MFMNLNVMMREMSFPYEGRAEEYTNKLKTRAWSDARALHNSVTSSANDYSAPAI